MSSYKHGAYFSEVPTSIVPPVRVDCAIPVIIGTAPVHTLEEGAAVPVNKPLLLYTWAEAAQQLGSLPAGAGESDYPLLQAVNIYLGRYGVAPVVAVNVFDPQKHVDDEGRPDVKKVAAADVIGGIDAASNKRTGLELVEEVFPRFGLLPGQILAPGFSDNEAVALVMGAKCVGINGHFGCTGIFDIPSSVRTYTEASQFVRDNNLTDKNLVAFFGRPVFNDAAEPGSVHLAGVTAQRDFENGNIPYWSPSNKRILANGMSHAGQELVLDSSQAAYLNGQGICTGFNFVGGLVAWGNRTAVYPGVTDVKDSFIPLRRMFNFVGNTLVQSAWQRVDAPLNRRLVGTICDSFNIWLNGLTAAHKLHGGRVEFLADDNAITDVMDGISRFHVYLTPPSPAREIDFILEYDPDYLSNLYSILE